MRVSTILIILCYFFTITHAQKIKEIGTTTLKRTAYVKFEKPVRINWVLPSTSSPAYEKNTTFTINLQIETPFKVSEKNFSILLNGRSYEGKSGEGKLRRKQKKENENTYTFERVIQAPPDSKESTVQVVYTTPNSKVWNSIPMVVKHQFTAKQSTLHLVSIGVGKYNEKSELKDLKYAENDAEAFYNLFQNQKQLFGRLNRIDLLIGENANSANVIAQLNGLKQMYENGEISPKDLIIIYISSHGITINEDEGDDFRIATSDYRASVKKRSTVSFKLILKSLEEIKCKRLIFMDACHSGGGVTSYDNLDGSKSSIPTAIQKFLQTPSGIDIIASSGAGELSYELEQYQHGSFTQALLDGLGGEANRNGDEIIDLDELMNYLKITVPNLNMAAKKPIQTPTRSETNLGALPIFILKN